MNTRKTGTTADNPLWRIGTPLLLLGLLALAVAGCESDGDDDENDPPDDPAETHSCELGDPGALTASVSENQICYVSGDNEPVVYESGVDGAEFAAVYNTDDIETTLETSMTDAITNSNVIVYVGGNTAGEYSSGNEAANFELYLGCDDAATEDPECTSVAIPDVYSIYTVSDCSEDGVDSALTINIEEFGAVGEQVRGTFEGVLVEYTFFPNHSIVCSNNGTVSGAFSVERGADVEP